MHVRNLILVTLVTLLPCTAIAGQFEDGVAAARLGDHQRAFELWHPLAEQGNASSQFNVGLMYEHGEGAPQNDVEAIKWYLMAARQGYVRAQVSVARMYASGMGVKKDLARAVEWDRKAANQGSASAQNSLGNSLIKGKGVARDYAQAHMWFSLAAAQENRTAMQNLRSIEQRMTPEEIAEAQKLLQEWQASHSQ